VRIEQKKVLNNIFIGKNLKDDVHEVCSKCPTCQKTKRTYKQYGHLPEKQAEYHPWEKLCVDLIGPYTIKRKGKKDLTLWFVTMIDPATSWFEVVEIKNKLAINIANIVEQTWLTRYPWPTEMTYDQGTEFMAEFANMIKNDYGINVHAATKRNPQANSMIERVHQTLANIVRTFQVHESEEEDPWKGVLSAAAFAIRATYHTTLKASPAQLVFGRDAIMNVKFEANWNLIRDRKQKLIQQNNKRENAKRIAHVYKKGDMVLYRVDSLSKFNNNPYEGPYPVIQVYENGTISIKRGSVIERINIRLVKPFKK